MTIQDHTQFNNLERVVSDDMNNLQNLGARERAEMIRNFARTFQIDIPPNAPVRAHLCSGLNVAQSGGTIIDIAPGLLGQQIAASPPDVPTPGALDSSYRFGVLYANTTIADPWDASEAYWLLQARVEQVTALSETRDIYNAATQTFAPSGSPIDKRLESQLVFTWKKGTTTALPSPDTGQCPLAGLYRPIGGGAITDADVFQLAIRFSDLSGFDSANGVNRRTGHRLKIGDGIFGSGSDAEFDFSGEVNGVKLFARSTGVVALNDTPFLDPSDSGVHGVANYWWYLYLAKVGDQIPSGLYPSVEHRGVLVASRIPPDDRGANSGTIDVPDPIGGTVSAGDAVHVGVYRGNTGTTMFDSHCSASGRGRIFSITALTMTSANSYQDGNTFDFATLGPGSTELLPYGVFWELRLAGLDADAAATANAFRFRWSETGGNRYSVTSLGNPTRLLNFVLLEPTINIMSRDVDATAVDALGSPLAAGTLGSSEFLLNVIGYQY